ncbi:MAG TPA: ribulose-phosphate 3-epimerase [Candidatus Angelobacter sp.]|nr:ribulose-phosphate 3-epimerase [Candidatus Angelobacter sp.]
MIELAPSILSADFARLADEVQAVAAGGATLLHVDVMDGHFVPNITIGMPVVAALRKVTRLPLDVHLMIQNPDRYISAFADSGADWISVHQEACVHLDRTLHQIRELGVKAGAVINPATPVSTLEEVLPIVDHVLIMSVNPGFGGQKFIPSTLDKVRKLATMRASLQVGFRIEIDGGIGPDNVADVVSAGVEVLVAGSAIFGRQSPKTDTQQMLSAALKGAVQRQRVGA